MAKIHFGWPNNNPLNIRINPANKWVGKIVPSRNRAFETFDTPENGMRASAIIFGSTYPKKMKVKTLQEAINLWAPAEDNNDPIAYAATVCRRAWPEPDSEMTPDTPINLGDPEILQRVFPAMAYVETGNKWQYADGVLEEGIARGLGQVKLKSRANKATAVSTVVASPTIVAEVVPSEIVPDMATIQSALSVSTDLLTTLTPYIKFAQYGLAAVAFMGIAVAIYSAVKSRQS